MQQSPNPSRSWRETATRWAPVVMALLMACGGDSESVTFTKEKDNTVMAEVESSWHGEVGQDSILLSLCEDREKTDAWNEPGDCQDLHVVRGGDRGIEHTEEEPQGCSMGGCPFDVDTYVRGTLSGTFFDHEVPVAGHVWFGNLYDSDKIFAHPYHLSLVCTDDPVSCDHITGTLDKDGTLNLEITLSGSDVPMTVTAQRTGDASCIANQ